MMTSCPSLVIAQSGSQSGTLAIAGNQFFSGLSFSVGYGLLDRKERLPGGIISTGTVGAGGTSFFTGTTALSGEQQGARLTLQTQPLSPQAIVIGGTLLTPSNRRNQNTIVPSAGNPNISIPFFSLATNQQESVDINVPGDFSGNASRLAYNDFKAADIYASKQLFKNAQMKVNLLGGYSYFYVKDDSHLNMNSTALRVIGPILEGTIFNNAFNAEAANYFNGGFLGGQVEFSRGPLRLNAVAKAAYGVNQTRLNNTDPASTTVLGNTTTGTVTGNNPGVFNFQPGRFTKDKDNLVVSVTAEAQYQYNQSLSFIAGYDYFNFGKVLLSRNALDLTASQTPAIQQMLSYHLQGFHVGAQATLD